MGRSVVNQSAGSGLRIWNVSKEPRWPCQTHVERPGIIAIILHAHKARPAPIIMLHEGRRIQPLIENHQPTVPLVRWRASDRPCQRRPPVAARRRLARRGGRVAAARRPEQAGVAHDARVATRQLPHVRRHGVVVAVAVVAAAAPAAEADEEGCQQDHGGNDGGDGDGDDAARGHFLARCLGRGGRHKSDGRGCDLSADGLNLLCGDRGRDWPGAGLLVVSNCRGEKRIMI
jgi:hypothetical protein